MQARYQAFIDVNGVRDGGRLLFQEFQLGSCIMFLFVDHDSLRGPDANLTIELLPTLVARY